MTCRTMCPEGRGQGFWADSARISTVSVVDILSASVVNAFDALSLSGLNLFGHWLSLLVRENCMLLGRASGGWSMGMS